METVKKSSFSIAKPGVKPSNAVEPGIMLTPTLNRFTINGLATRLIGLVSGTGNVNEEKLSENSITLIVNEESEDINNKFYLCKGIDGNSAKLAAHENEQGNGKELSFTYSGIYSQILIAVVKNDIMTPKVPNDRLRHLGLAIDKISLHKVYAKLEKDQLSDLDGTLSEPVQLYRLFDFMISEHNPRQIKK